MSDRDRPFHAGEREAQRLAGVRPPPAGAGIRDFMPDQHRAFFEQLPYLFAATVDPAGYPAASVLHGPPGFIHSPDPWTLRVAGRPDAADPSQALFGERRPLGLLGLDLSNRRRNRANGFISELDADGFAVTVRQSFGNCPQYIQTRLVESAARSPSPTEPLAGLDAPARMAIEAADTFFVASRAPLRNGGVDISHRGGRPGFVRVDGASLTIPDFRGNRFFNTLGNLLREPRTALLFPDFETGDILHLTGRAEVLFDETLGFEGAERLWRLHVEGGWRRRSAIPLRWSFDDWSPMTERTGVWPSVAR